ncbi:MAG: MFS transporter [archaeon]|nr:MFS transporter [archaeon]
MSEPYRTIEDRKTLAIITALIALSTLIDGLDSTILNVALPTMSKDFNITIADSSWIPVAYTIALASLILPFAKIAKNGWMREFFIGGTALFTVCSVICAFSGDFLTFILSRLMQGVGAAMVISSVPLMIIRLLPPDHKGRGMAIMGMASGLAVVLGPSLGGIITSCLSWHWIFLVNVPIGAFVILLALRTVPGPRDHTMGHYPDVINSALTFVCICFSLTFLQNIDESELSDGFVILCGAGAALSLFLLMWRSHVRRDTAIVSSEMLFRRNFALLCLAFTMTTIIIVGAQYVLPYYLEYVKGYPVSEIGYLLSVASIVTIVLSAPVGKWCDSRGCKVPSVGAGVFRLLFTATFAVGAATMELPVLIIGLVCMGISMACAGTGLATFIIHHTEERYQDESATFIMVVNYMAAAFGVTVTSLVYSLNTSGSNLPQEVLAGFESCMWFFVVLAVVAVVCTLVVPNIVPKKKE